jgi:hypothetical protein
MKNLTARAIQGIFLLALCSGPARAQEKALTRSFRAGSVEAYRVEMTLHAEVHRVSLETTGEKTYVKPVTQAGDARLEWAVTREIGSVAEDGTAWISESIKPMEACCGESSASGQNDAALRKAIDDFCAQRGGARTLNYHEETNGLIRDLPPEAAVYLGEKPPLLLTLWLRRAVRPSVILPTEPLVLGSESRHTTSPAIRSMLPGATGSETTEWLEASDDPSAATLHVVQELTWVTGAKRGSSAPHEHDTEAKESFFADSLTTLSLLDGSVMNATRSATRETRWILEPVKGLAQPPEFRIKLTVTVTLRKLS